MNLQEKWKSWTFTIHCSTYYIIIHPILLFILRDEWYRLTNTYVLQLVTLNSQVLWVYSSQGLDMSIIVTQFVDVARHKRREKQSTWRKVLQLMTDGEIAFKKDLSKFVMLSLLHCPVHRFSSDCQKYFWCLAWYNSF